MTLALLWECHCCWSDELEVFGDSRGQQGSWGWVRCCCTSLQTDTASAWKLRISEDQGALSLALKEQGCHCCGCLHSFAQVSAVRRGLNPFYSPWPVKPMLAHHSPPQLLAARQAPVFGAIWWQEALGTLATTTSGQDQGRQGGQSLGLSSAFCACTIPLCHPLSSPFLPSG